MADEIVQAGDPEVEAAFEGPSIFANRFFVTVAGAVARFTFSEQPPTGSVPRYRAAVTMTVNDMMELRATLNKLAEHPNFIEVAMPPKPSNNG